MHILFYLCTIFSLSLFGVGEVRAQEQGVVLNPAHAYIFERSDCTHCQDLKIFIEDHEIDHDGYDIAYIDVYTTQGRDLFDEVTQKLGTGKVTPITLAGGEVYVGFAESTVGQALIAASGAASVQQRYPLEKYFDLSAEAITEGEVCPEDGSVPCVIPEKAEITVPVLGSIDPQQTSLVMIAAALGFVDGFNPCAMWVLLTFLIILSQVGSRKKMIYVAGLFILAEAVMYFLILNVWYQTWDFIALDGIVTPLVGVLALGSGVFFLYKYLKSRGKPLTCDVTNLEHQRKTEQKISTLVARPMSIAGACAIIGLALSVNIIEFACSVGIPQAFTKILEINQLSFLQYQGYTMLYTLFYMADDVIIFGLAIAGYEKFYAVGQKYSHLATGIAGILMLLLGILMLFAPDVLSF